MSKYCRSALSLSISYALYGTPKFGRYFYLDT